MLKFILLTLLFVPFSVSAYPQTFECTAAKSVTPVPSQDLTAIGLSGGVATYENGYPVIRYDKDLADTPEVMNHVIAHECAHHILGHTVRPSPRNYYALEQLQEAPADCLASKMLVSQMGYGDKEFKLIGDFLKFHVGYPRAERVLSCAK